MARRPRLPGPVPAIPAGGWQATGWRLRPMLRPRVIGLASYQLVQGIPLQPANGQALVSSGSFAVPALVQSAPGATASSGTSLTLTLPSGTTAGNCLVVYVGAVQGVTNPVVSGVTLGGSGTNAVKAEQENSASTNDCEIWVIWDIAGGQTSVVVNFTAGSGGSQGNAAYAEEWSGVQNTASPVTAAVNGANAGSSSWSSGSSGSPPAGGLLALGAVAANSGTAATLTGPSSPWVNKAQLNVSTVLALMAGHQVLSAAAAETYSGSISASTGWSAVVALLLAGTGPGLPSGQAQVQLGPSGLGNIWYPTQITVATTTSMAQGFDGSTCNIYLGPSISPLTLLGTVVGGGILAAALPNIQPGQFLIAQWTGANPGDTAVMNVQGTMDALA
jgi:hypothetical protein